MTRAGASARVALAAQAAASWFLAGLCWMCQLVHYPLIRASVDVQTYEQLNIRLTQRVVIAPMAIEVLAVAFLLARPPKNLSRAWSIAGAILLAAIWASTFAFQYPQHQALAAGGPAGILDSLIATNWIRTAGWTLRGVLALVMLDRAREI